MKKVLLLLPLLLLLGCESHLTFGKLLCPVEDMTKVESDLQECHVYDLDAVDKALGNHECRKCMEAKGYQVLTTPDNNASK